MDPRLQRRVQRYGWDKAAGDYEAGWRDQLEPAQSLMLEMAALRPGERVLDVACGTGLVSFRALEQVGAAGSVLGTDISAEMVEGARRRADEAGRPGPLIPEGTLPPTDPDFAPAFVREHQLKTLLDERDG